jgi:hypothetical protein
MAKPAQFLTDHHGEKVAVVIALKEYKKMLEKMEDLEDIRAYDTSKASQEKPVPYEKVRAKILRRRK